MFLIEMLPAEYGDCLWIEYGKPGGRRYRVLIDGGLAGCGKILRKRIKELPVADRRFDLVVVTHYDTDHINGIINLLKNMPEGFGFDYFWFNGYDQIKPQGTRWVTQGEELSDLLRKLEAKTARQFWNKPFRRKAVMLPDTGPPKSIRLKGGMKMTVLGPNSKGVNLLFKEWDNVVKQEKAAAKLRKDPETAPEEDETFVPRDLREIQVASLAAAGFEEDDSVANGSSIVLLAEYENQRVLLTGDAFPGDILEGLSRISGDSGKITLSAVKLSHHGSKNNNNNDFFSALDCRNFMVSTNGKRHGHPDREGIARVIHNKREEPTLYFNYNHGNSLVWSDAGLQQKYGYKTVYADNGHLKIDLTGQPH